MAENKEEYRSPSLILRFEGQRCIHSRNCVLGHPGVFQPNVEGHWIRLEAASAEQVAHLARLCPSGAITYERLDGGENEGAPPVNHLRIWENGPLALHADLRIAGQEPAYRATLCRCGASQNKPFCDRSHVTANFQATGEPPTLDSPALTERGGRLSVTPLPNGPLQVEGNLEICAASGRTVQRTQKAFLCRCGASAKKPFCDGSHKKVGFNAP
ncbi:MAG: CDGSH iron-sulfur domain-containing protein [bacterium]